MTSRKAARPFSIKPDANWIRARRDLLDQLKKEVERRVGSEPKDVVRYTRRYERELAKKWRVSSKTELLKAIESADLVYGGDFHALGPAQRTHLKILRTLPENRPVVLALESFSIRAQRWLDAYVAGQISTEELRKKSKWETSWGFPWEHYRPLIELAKSRKWRLLGLNSGANVNERTARQLKAREVQAARVIAKAMTKSIDAEALVYVIFGDLHLARTHLPKAVETASSRKPRTVFIHLNSEKIYFELARRGLEIGVDVVKLGHDSYCVLSSPPWVKWQSYLLFLDRTVDREGDDVLDDRYADVDPTDQVARLVKLAAFDLGLDIKVDDLAVYADDESIWRSVERKVSRRERDIARYLLASGRSFYLPSAGAAYLSRSTVNHAAAVAGEYLHAKISNRKRALWRFPQDFRSLIWAESVAYFVSKLVNHKRQAETLSDLQAQLAGLGASGPAREILRLALDVSLSELVWLKQKRRRMLRFRPRRKSSYTEAARILGGMLGERLYLAFRSRRLTREAVVSWLQIDPSAPGFTRIYERILARLSVASIENRKPRRERL